MLTLTGGGNIAHSFNYPSLEVCVLLTQLCLLQLTKCSWLTVHFVLACNDAILHKIFMCVGSNHVDYVM